MENDIFAFFSLKTLEIKFHRKTFVTQEKNFCSQTAMVLGLDLKRSELTSISLIKFVTDIFLVYS
jgi:hypothetical protein